MNTVAIRKLSTLAALLALSAAGCGSSGGDDGGGGGGPPSPSGAGIQQNLSLTAMQNLGWTICYEDTYANAGTATSSILAGCQGAHMMLACGQLSTPDRLTVAAADVRSVVTQSDAAGATTHHVANGVGWYFTPTQSWGFFPAGQAVDRNQCDLETSSLSALRLCWNATDSGSGAGAILEGFRCGENTGLNGATWRRVVLVHP